MQVTIEHVQRRRGYGITTTVVFSREEQAIIRKRKLQKIHVVEGYKQAPMGTLMFMSPAVTRPLGVIILLSPLFLYWFYPQIQHMQFLWFIGVGLILHSYYITLFKDRRQGNQIIRLGDLLRSPKFTLWADNPGHLRAMDDDVKQGLQHIKALIEGSAELSPKQRFEL